MNSYLGQDMLYALEIISCAGQNNYDDKEILSACDYVSEVINTALKTHVPEKDDIERDFYYKYMRTNIILMLLNDANLHGKKDVNLQENIKIVRKAIDALQIEKGR